MTENGSFGGRPSDQASDDELDHLLSRGSLGGSQRERIRAAIEESAAARSPGRSPARSRQGGARLLSLRRLAGVAVAATAVAAGALWIHGSSEQDAFRRKGNAGPSTVMVDVTCLHATLLACPRGSLLAFSAEGSPHGQEMFATAYLQKSGEAERIWLLRNEPAGADAVGARGLLWHGARIPDQQPAGDYTVEVLLTRRPLIPSAAGPVDVRAEDLVTRAKFETTVPP